MIKRGISPLIASVLLVGLAVIVGLIVWFFTGDFLEEQQETVVEDAYNAIVCSGEVNIETELCYVHDDELKVSLKNRGSVDISDLKIVVSTSSE